MKRAVAWHYQAGKHKAWATQRNWGRPIRVNSWRIKSEEAPQDEQWPPGRLESYLWANGNCKATGPDQDHEPTEPATRREDSEVKDSEGVRMYDWPTSQGLNKVIRDAVTSCNGGCTNAKTWLEKFPGTPAPARISLRRAVRTARVRGRPSWKRKRGPPEFPLLAK